jgi:hypothetical protein
MLDGKTISPSASFISSRSFPRESCKQMLFQWVTAGPIGFDENAIEIPGQVDQLLLQQTRTSIWRLAACFF